MAPKQKQVASLFHPKKTNKTVHKTPSTSATATASTSTTTSTPTSPRKATPRPPRPKPEPEPEVDELQLPDGHYQEFKLMSSALNGWKYDVMKFDSRKTVDISTWKAPIKLNRKELRREEPSSNSAPQAVGPMLGPDGKPVVGADGRTVMVDSEGRPIHSTDDSSSGSTPKDGKGKAAPTNAKKRFQKKTRQVFAVPEHIRRLRREERYPWVMEDMSQSEVWVGKLEDIDKSQTHAFFMPAANDVFKFVPAHRWYKFQKKPNHYIPTLEEAETMLDKHKKNKDPQVWLIRNRNGKGPSEATAAIFKAESEGRALSGSNSLVHSSGQSLGPGGRRLKTVDSGMGNLFGDDDEDGGDAKRRRTKEYGEEGDLDEQVYEEDFADDEEKVDLDDKDDEDAKELEERLKREYKSANKQREGYLDESDEEEGGGLTKDGKAMKKLIRNLEKNNAYDSDDERNPYASSDDEEEEEEELPVIPPEPAIQQQPQQVPSRSSSQTPKPGTPRPPQNGTSTPRATSPVPAPGLGGHSIVAKRATSPKAPKLKQNNVSRGNSPLSAGAGTSTSPGVAGPRATSPMANGGSRAGSPVVQSPTNSQKPNNKRKATDDPAGSPTTVNGAAAAVAAPKPKKRKGPSGTGTSASTSLVPVGELEDKMVIDWLKNTPNASTRDCIQHFTPYLTDEGKKGKFTALVKEVAQLKGGVLVLRNAFRGSAAPSPAPTPTA